MTAQPSCSVYLPTYTRFTAAVVTHKYAFSNIARVQFNLNCTLTYICMKICVKIRCNQT